MKIMAFDPGRTTGWVYIIWQRETSPSFEGGTLGPEPHHKALWKLLHERQPELIVAEHFIQTGGYVVLDSREYEGILILYSQEYNIPIVLQNASEGKSIFTDKVIPAKMNKHTKDALRHGLHYITTVLKDYRFLKSERPLLDGPELQ
jgi:hypothetical protein